MAAPDGWGGGRRAGPGQSVRGGQRDGDAGVRGRGAGPRAVGAASTGGRPASTPTRSQEEGEECLRDSGNFCNQLLVRKRKCFLMFGLIIDQHSTCLIAASCRLARGSRCVAGGAAAPHQSPPVRRRGRRAPTPSEGTGVALFLHEGGRSGRHGTHTAPNGLAR